MCRQYITGRVLEVSVFYMDTLSYTSPHLPLLPPLTYPQAGDKHFHPGCASCCKCGLSFDEGEDMCIAGEDIWHLDCDKVRAEQGIHTGQGSLTTSIPAQLPSWLAGWVGGWHIELLY